ncbi:MAG: hypothetical protein KIT09_33825 [Bryobacteraceae bacterium]|nr:hypothetical protein [Bryobacteraceae bacterium]
MSHPDAGSLALFAGGELPLWSRWQVGRHVGGCVECRREVEAFRGKSVWLRETGTELPPERHWPRLAAEMKANIQVGLAAGACVGGAREISSPFGWRVAAALACITLVIVSGWFLHLPAPVPRTDGVVLAASRSGIELKNAEGALTLKHHGAQPALVSVSAQGSIAARFVDDETGMVTINNVYVQ